ncbi:M56 family metallopeptidase [Maribacter sp. TH_r10]|uniref:M56 family metallopeptidase n=1 Tax=Maribacter sp. TH_r10 TaxID=3082086 RepID=UPI002955A59E|nr:M56 family metallopeptidase [Maribacter sp. TH_r10]MDV7139891.1 M56 family metallopeptidase [Maribacter sp. TH_r10]
MIQYILECISFQLVFLIVYDFFLKRETFFQWNRWYLLGTHVLSLFLPWIKIEAFTTEVANNYGYPEFLWNMQEAPVEFAKKSEPWIELTWLEGVFLFGVLMALFLFAYKMYQIYLLRKNGEIQYYKEFTQIIISNSHLAFSFFKSIFLGDQVVKEGHDKIIQHELVHIKQRHTIDLMIFELLRIGCWFNPLVYIYQNRISELHEFIADAQVAKTNKKDQYQLMLSQVFQTQHISFINQFFKSSLIKKRIVMLQKSKSKKILRLKYLVLFPVLITMLFYTSCNSANTQKETSNESTLSDKIVELRNEIEAKESLTTEEKKELVQLIYEVYPKDIKGISGKNGELKYGGVPFAVVDEVPVFPGCEDATDKRACFQQKMQEHISKNFHYPEEAQKLGYQGRVNVLFTINSSGEIENIKKRGPHKLLEEEVHRIISRLPQMQPGKQKGEVVDVPYSIPVSFVLD